MKSISQEEFLKENTYLRSLNTVCGKINFETTEISRLGLALYSKSLYFATNRIQLVGDQEHKLVENSSKEDLKKLFENKMPMIIFSRGNLPNEEFINIATKKDVLVCQSDLPTAKVFSKTYSFLEKFLAEQTQVHGVMLSIYGKGILIKGESGVGKSEVALELIKRGHILISDDMVIFKKFDGRTLEASSPTILQNKMEIRGIGIVDVQKLFGVTSVLLNVDLDLIVNLVNNDVVVDRIGTDYLYDEILGVKKKKINIPILSGKNIANLIEVAVANFQLIEDYKYNASEEFVKNLNEELLKKKVEYENN